MLKKFLMKCFAELSLCYGPKKVKKKYQVVEHMAGLRVDGMVYGLK